MRFWFLNRPCAVLVSLWIAQSARAGTVWIAVANPPSPCGFEQLADALRPRLPDTQISSGHGNSGDDVQISLNRTSRGWTLEVQAPGHPVLRRPLPYPQEDCVALSEAAALMTDRYLEGIQWTGASAVVPHLPPPPPPPPWHLGVTAAGGYGVGLTGIAPMAQLDLESGRGAWRWGISGLYEGGGQLAVVTPSAATGTLLQQSAAFQAIAGRRFALGPGALRLDLTAGAELFWVWSWGPSVLHRDTAIAPLPFIGLRAGYELRLTAHWTLSLRVQSRAHAGQISFSVDAYTPRLVTHWVDGDLALAIGYVFF